MMLRRLITSRKITRLPMLSLVVFPIINVQANFPSLLILQDRDGTSRWSVSKEAWPEARPRSPTAPPVGDRLPPVQPLLLDGALRPHLIPLLLQLGELPKLDLDQRALSKVNWYLNWHFLCTYLSYLNGLHSSLIFCQTASMRHKH